MGPAAYRARNSCQLSGNRFRESGGDGGEYTYRVPGLLNEYLSQAYHVSAVLESLGKGDHLIRSILLVAILACSEEGREGGLRKWIALGSTASFKL
jgi:hypothetical protein